MDGKLRRSPLRRQKDEESVNPMDGLANLADVMLVLACGLMLALIINWNVDVGPTETLTGLDQGMEITESGSSTEEEDFLEDQAAMEEMGIVYKDPTTGKLYMVTKE